ncbi:DUF4123 domain-containing protein [Cupriavidus sp. SW-Y-13]|uniref:DUF4123 domain-containing protein n=1 Tax=Cupriavidus sp. SW-Y-13 TaxID=2653854 RepID=UPI0013662382|nr:DUF4123 domain-containing protein [Cupriavidus sp. SW-Y-13]
MSGMLPFDSDWREPVLRESFRAALRADLRHWLKAIGPIPGYALVDAGQLHLTEVQLVPLLQTHALPFEPILRHTPEAGMEAVGPYLVELENATADAVDAVVGLMEYGWVVSFLSSRLPLFKLHSHLRGCLNGILEDGAHVQLRYYDPRILAQLLQVAPDEIRTALTGPIDTFAWWDRQLCWQSRRGQDSSTFQSPQAALSLPDRLIRTVGQSAQADLTYSLILSELPMSDQMEALSPHLRYQIVAELLTRARGYGLMTQANLSLFCTLGLTISPTFDQVTSTFKTVWANPAGADAVFAAAVDGLSATDWQAIDRLGQQERMAMRERFAMGMRRKTLS